MRKLYGYIQVGRYDDWSSGYTHWAERPEGPPSCHLADLKRMIASCID